MNESGPDDPDKPLRVGIPIVIDRRLGGGKATGGKRKAKGKVKVAGRKTVGGKGKAVGGVRGKCRENPKICKRY